MSSPTGHRRASKRGVYGERKKSNVFFGAFARASGRGVSDIGAVTEDVEFENGTSPGAEDMSSYGSSDGMASPSPRIGRRREREESFSSSDVGIDVDSEEESDEESSSWWMPGGKGDMQSPDGSGTWGENGANRSKSRTKTPPSSIKRRRTASGQSLTQTMEAECRHQQLDTGKRVQKGEASEEKPEGAAETEYGGAVVPSSPWSTASSRLSPTSCDENQLLEEQHRHQYSAGDAGQQKAQAVGARTIGEQQLAFSWDSKDLETIRLIQKSLMESTAILRKSDTVLEKFSGKGKTDYKISLPTRESIVTPCGFCTYDAIDRRWEIKHRPLPSRFSRMEEAKLASKGFISHRCTSGPTLVAYLEHESWTGDSIFKSSPEKLKKRASSSKGIIPEKKDNTSADDCAPPSLGLVQSILRWSELSDLFLLLRDELVLRGFSKGRCDTLVAGTRQGEEIVFGPMLSKYLSSDQNSCKDGTCSKADSRSDTRKTQPPLLSCRTCCDNGFDVLSALASVTLSSSWLDNISVGPWRIKYPCSDGTSTGGNACLSSLPSSLQSIFVSSLVEKCLCLEKMTRAGSIQPHSAQTDPNRPKDLSQLTCEKPTLNSSGKSDGVDRSDKKYSVSSNDTKSNSIKQPVQKTSGGKKRKKNSNIAAELASIQRDEGGTASADRDIVQLFASDFNNRFDPNIHGRSKRKIKAVVRFDATPLTSSQQQRMREIAGKTGNGFTCPQCSELCPYNARECGACHLPCRYVAGTGVVVCRERDHVTQAPPSLYEAGRAQNKKPVSEIPKTPQTPKSHSNSPSRTSLKSGKKSKEKEIVPVESRKMNQITMDKSPPPVDAKSSHASPNPQGQTGACGFPVEDCEVCFEPYPAGKTLRRHRMQAHNLNTSTFGCPYCDATFKLTEGRKRHIQKKHPGKPWEVSAKERATKKLLIYVCHLCSTKKTGMGLRSHYRNQHQISVSSVLDKVMCVCPFCFDKNKEISFKTEEDLLVHMSKCHEGCTVIERTVLNLGGDGLLKKGSRKRKSCDSEANDRKTAEKPVMPGKIGTSKSEKVVKQSLNKLDFASVVSSCDVDVKSHLNTSCLEEVLDEVDTKLTALQRTLEPVPVQSKLKDRSGKFHSCTEEKIYLEESKVYQRGIRDRSQKADCERIEKLKYKETCEQMLRVIQYENRNKKRTKGEIEYKALLSRPLKYISSEETKTFKKEQCCVGDKCELCNGDYARVVVTDEEIKNAGGDILKAIPIPITQEASEESILSPPFRHYSDDDSPRPGSGTSDVDLNAGHSTTSQNRGVRRRDHYWKLSKMKNDLLFIQQYNKGLFAPSRDELRKRSAENPNRRNR